jgi:DNA modification methylase
VPRSKPDSTENQHPIGAVRLDKQRAKTKASTETAQARPQPRPGRAGSRTREPIEDRQPTSYAPRERPPRQRRALSHVGGDVAYTGAPEFQAVCETALAQRSNESDTRAHVHGFHAYPARLHPHTAQSLVLALSAPGQTVLDPFCGSGTVLVESVIAKRNARGTDLNPLATLLAQTKCAGLSERNQQNLLEQVQQIREFADERRLRKAGPTRRYGPVERELFDIHVLLELDSLRAGIENTPKGTLHQNLQLILSSLLVKLSRQSSDTVEKATPRRIAAGYPGKLFQMRASEWVRQVQEYERLAPLPRTKVRTFTADARELAPIATASVDLIVTSPPYPGVYDYYAHHALRLRWMNLPGGELEDKELGSKRALSLDVNGINKWRADWRGVLLQFQRVLSQGGKACIIMADSAVGKTPLRSDVETLRAIEGTSLSLVAHAKQTRPLFHRATAEVYDKAPRSEHLLILEKSAAPQR